MPLVGEGQSLEILCTAGGTPDPRFHHFLGPGMAERSARTRVARNIVDALAALEASGDYVLTDLKPENIMVNPAGQTYLVDLDAMQIANGNSVLFSATGITDEYPPPEFYQHPKLPQRVPKSFERFSMAVVLYRLLLNIHPFAGATPAGGLLENIAAGYFANGRHRNRFRVVPPPHGGFISLPNGIQALFLRCFDAGTDDPTQRPAASEWVAALQGAGVQPGTVSSQQRRNILVARTALPGAAPPPVPPPVAPNPRPRPALTLQTAQAFVAACAASASGRSLPRLAGIWQSATQPVPHVLGDVEAGPAMAAPAMRIDTDAELAVYWTTQELIHNTPTGRVLIGRRVHLSYLYAGAEMLFANFSSGMPANGWHRVWNVAAPLPRTGSVVRDIYDRYEFAFFVRLPDWRPWYRRLMRKRVAICVDVSSNPLSPVSTLDAAGPVSEATDVSVALIEMGPLSPATTAAPMTHALRASSHDQPFPKDAVPLSRHDASMVTSVRSIARTGSRETGPARESERTPDWSEPPQGRRQSGRERTTHH
jgi:hypothetical protein